MVDKSIIKSNLSDRLKEINEYVDKVKPNDYINELINIYSTDLKYYKYIETVEEFSILSLKGSLKYINKYDKKLRNGGLLIKIYKDEKTKKWYGIIKKSNKKYYICFDSNYIFYMKTQNDRLNDLLECFISDLDKGLYEII
jgi:hypothetical protein